MAEVYDRWHKSRPRLGESECPEHRGKVPSADHSKGLRWQARWRDAEGRQRKLNFATRAKAEAQAVDVAADLQRGVYVDPAAAKVTLRTFAEDWMTSQTGDANTRQAVEIRLRVHVLPALGSRELRALRPSVIQAWVRGLSDSLAETTVHTVFSTLSSVLTAAVDDGLMPKNPCRSPSVKLPKITKKKLEPWQSSRVTAVAEALPLPYQATVYVGACLGLRQGEIFGLSPDDVDWLRRVVHVRRQVKIIGTRLVFAPPKGGKERDVPLAASLSLLLAAHMKRHPARMVTLPWREPDGAPTTVRLFFVSRESKALNRNYFNPKVWRPALVAAGVVAKVETGRQTAERVHGMHALRHHFASVLLESGVSITALAEYLGHTDPGFTLRIYTHLMPTSEDRMRTAIDNAIGGHSGQSSALPVPSESSKPKLAQVSDLPA